MGVISAMIFSLFLFPKNLGRYTSFPNSAQVLLLVIST
jgi:hypothetical protein